MEGNIQDTYPLTPAQEGLLFHHLRQEGHSDPYVTLTLLEAESQSDLDSLIAALQITIARHDTLRTAFHWERVPKPMQVVHRQASLQVEQLILDSNRDTLEQLRALMRPGVQSFDLRVAPMMRLQVAVGQPGMPCYALLHVHQIAVDDNSLAILIDEVRAHISGIATTLPTPGAFGSYVAQSQKLALGGHGENILHRWLAGVDEPTLPFGLSNVHGTGDRLEEHSQILDVSVRRQVRALARRFDYRPETLIHAAWGLVVAATSGRDDVVFGTVASARPSGGPEAQRTVGMFVNTLPLRLQLQGITVSELLNQAQQRLSELLDNCGVSLTSTQRYSGISGSVPLFTAILKYRHAAATHEAQWKRVDGVRAVITRSWTNYPISLSVVDLGEDFALTAQTDRQVDPKQITSHLSSTLSQLAKALEAAPGTPVQSISGLSESDRHQLLETFNGEPRHYPRGKLIHQVFEEQAARAPNSTAVVADGASASYGELNRRANQLARFIRMRGAGPDQLIGLCVERSVEMIVGILAILKAGAAYVPLDPSYPPERLALVLSHARPPVILTQDALKSALPQTLASLVPIDGQWGEIDKHNDTNLSPREVDACERNLAYVIFTSGSTGEPKGVMVEHAGAVNLAFDLDRRYHHPYDCRRIGVNASFAFDSSVNQLLQLLHGCTLYLVPQAARTDAPALLRFLDHHEIEGIDCTPSQLQTWISAGLLDKTGASALRTVIVAGEAVDPALWDTLTRCTSINFYNDYGPTECTVECTFASLREVSATPHIGRPTGNAKIYILGPQLQPVPVGVTGEIFIGGAGVARGYLNRPALTAERFLANPFADDRQARMYKSGDLGRWRRDGNIEYVGRNDRQVKIRGHRIELGEIESQLLRFPHVREVVVLVREDVPGVRRLVAYMTFADSSLSADTPGPRELRTHATAVLPAFMVPSAYVVLDKMPLTPSAKIDVRALPAPDWDLQSSERFEPPQGDIEESLAGIWSRILGAVRIGRHDNFFELGGHSLLAMEIIVAIANQFEVQVPVTAVFQSPTVAEIARQVETQLQFEEFTV